MSARDDDAQTIAMLNTPRRNEVAMPARVATYNLGDPKATALDRLATLADFICTQEGGDRDSDVAAFLRHHPGWEQFGADLDRQRGKTPMLYNAARYEVLDAGAVPMDDGEGAGKPGAGGGERKWLLWLLVRDRETGAEFYVANTHAVPSLRYRNRRLHHAEHMRRIAVWSRSLTRPVVVTGDFNASWSHDHLDPLRAAGFRLANGPEWTHRKGALKRRIDLILVRGVKVRSAEVIDTPSDHRAVVAVLDVPAVKPPEEPAVTYHFLTDLADACRKSGLEVVEIAGWQKRGRPSYTGGFNPRGILVHHTGSNPPDSTAYVEWMARTGRGDLPAPLCQIALGRDGTVYVSAAGRANHAGDAKASGPIPAGDGNELYIGIEALNNGTEGWSTTQHAAYVRLCRALVDHYGWTPEHVRAHKETSHSGKWDPGELDMTKFRRAITAATTQEDDMPLSDEDLDKIAYRVWAKEIGGGDNRKPARLHLINSANASLRNEAKSLDPQAVAAAVVALLPSGTLDEAVVVSGVKRALSELVNDSKE